MEKPATDSRRTSQISDPNMARSRRKSTLNDPGVGAAPRRMSLVPPDGMSVGSRRVSTYGSDGRRVSNATYRGRLSLAPGMMASDISRLHMRRGTMRVDGSLSEESGAFQQIQVENSYKLEPEKDTKFKVSEVETTIRSVLELHLNNEKTYRSEAMKRHATNLATVIKQEVKDLGYERYKLVCHVIIGESRGQGFEAVSRSIWDQKVDNYACASFQNNTLFALGMVHGTYFE